MALLDRVRLRTGSDLPDSELTAMINAITAELDARFGPVGQITVELGDLEEPQTRALRTLRLARPAAVAQAITVTEISPSTSGLSGDTLVLAADDFRVLHDGRTLQRLASGTNGRSTWAPLVKVTYTPVSNQAARDEATIKLVALDLSYRGGLKSERAGDYQFTLSGDIAADREAILQTLESKRGFAFA